MTIGNYNGHFKQYTHKSYYETMIHKIIDICQLIYELIPE